MKDKKLKLYFFLCISAFFLLLAVTLYYSFGYNYNPQTGESFQVGAIVLRTTPRDATIFQDDKAVENSGFLGGVLSPFVKIENLDPFISHKIKVSKDGFNEWSKNVTIESGQVAKYENIVLLKKEYKNSAVLENLTLPTDGKVYSTENKNELLFQGTIGAKSGLFLVDIRDEKYNQVLDDAQLSLMGDIREVKWTEDDSRVVLRTAANTYLIDLSDDGHVYLISADVAEALSRTPEAAIYLFNHFIIFGKDGTIFSFDYVSKEIKQVATGINNFYVYQGTLFFFKSDDTSASPVLYSANLDNPDYSVLRVSTMPEGYSKDVAFSLQRYGNTLLILSDGALYFVDRTAETHKINSGVKDARFFSHGERILYYSNNEIWIYYIENKTSQPIKSAGDNELLTRFSGTLSNIYVYADEEHLLYQENNSLKFTEMDNRDNRNTFFLMDNASGQKIFYLGDQDLIYFIGSDNKFYKISLREE